MMSNIVLADDHPMFRQGLKALLEREGYDVVAEAANGHEAVRHARQLNPRLAVLDLGMPLLNGIDAAREIHKQAPNTEVVLLTMYEEDAYVLEALRAGIRGYVLKAQAASDLLSAIKEVLRGAVYLSPGISKAVVDAYVGKSELPADPLTDRERQVLQLVAEGKTTKQVAEVLGLSVKTADSHRTRIMQKLEIHETASLVRYAIRRGFIKA
ncbi:MAG TPA: response regulator transcription factor [Gammaproteobacteria bacterium]|jgi:DNA-binding NarL/FixJ family response regulator|nr:response regulator transcription factor [Gammaproteobacteria bacterium]